MRCMPGVTLNKVRHGKNYNLKFNNKWQDSSELVVKDEGYRAGEYICNITLKVTGIMLQIQYFEF